MRQLNEGTNSNSMHSLASAVDVFEFNSTQTQLNSMRRRTDTNGITIIAVAILCTLFNSFTPFILLEVSSQLCIDTYTITWNTPADCSTPTAIEQTSDANVLLFACDYGQIVEFDPRTGAWTSRSIEDICSSPIRFHRDKTNGSVLTACGMKGGIIAIDGNNTRTVMSSVDCPLAVNVWMDADRNIVYANCFGIGIRALHPNGEISTLVECDSTYVLVGDETGRLVAECDDKLISIDRNNNNSVTILKHNETCGTVTSMEVNADGIVFVGQISNLVINNMV